MSPHRPPSVVRFFAAAHLALVALLVGLLALACAAPPADPTAEEQPAADDGASRLVGTWRAVLESPGGPLPFALVVTRSDDDTLRAVIHNAQERVAVERVTLDEDGHDVVFGFDGYDARIAASFDADGALVGRWSKVVPNGESALPFRAAPASDGAARFGAVETPAASADARASIAGAWATTFLEVVDDGEEAAEPEVARGEFAQEADGRVVGTFLTPTGDYRFLEGVYDAGVVRLSTFDGAHAFLFRAEVQADGTLSGNFWSRDVYHATWTARPLAEGETVLPDAWAQVALTNDDGRFRFAFPDLDGNAVDQDDPRFDGKVVLVNIFGSWCPNCNDKAPLLTEWDRAYRDQGLEIVGLAYEFSGDPERDRTMVRRYRDRFGIDYPLLLAGVSDKAQAAESLPDLDRVLAYPTTVFIDRQGRVRTIHSGFAGPGTGPHHEALKAELRGLIETLLAEGA